MKPNCLECGSKNVVEINCGVVDDLKIWKKGKEGKIELSSCIVGPD